MTLKQDTNTLIVNEILSTSQNPLRAEADGLWAEMLQRDYGWVVERNHFARLTFSGSFNGFHVVLDLNEAGRWAIRSIGCERSYESCPLPMDSLKKCLDLIVIVTSLLGWMHSEFEPTDCDPHLYVAVHQAVMDARYDVQKAILDAECTESISKYLGWSYKTQLDDRLILYGDFDSYHFEIEHRPGCDWCIRVLNEWRIPQREFLGFYYLHDAINAVRRWTRCRWWAERAGRPSN